MEDFLFSLWQARPRNRLKRCWVLKSWALESGPPVGYLVGVGGPEKVWHRLALLQRGQIVPNPHQDS